MSDCHKEFATLIKATLHYLQDEWSEHAHATLKEPPPPKIKEEKKRPSPPKPISTPKQIEKVLNWHLNPLPLLADSSLQFTSYYQPIPLLVPIRLVVTDSTSILFLQSVARALTQLIAPAALYEGKLDPLLTNQNIQLVLAPLSLLKKRFPQVDLHQFLTLDGPTLLPLADHYDTELKRALWNTLKSFPPTPPSS